MAHRIITQVVVTGVRVFGRAFTEAYRQANASKAYTKTGATGGSFGSSRPTSSITLEEACKILDVAPVKGAKTDMEPVMERFKKLFDLNDPTKGGSFYLQSKVLRARERIEQEVRSAVDKEEEIEAMKRPIKAKFWKDQ